MSYDKELITAQALAAALNLSVETIWRYTRENRIPFIELGNRQYRYNLTDVVRTLSGSSVREKEAGYITDTTKKYTYQDYLELPDEPGFRFEVLDGELIREASPNVPHQRASLRLQRILEDYFWESDPDGEVFIAPLDVTLHNLTVVQPDIFYVAGAQKSIVQYDCIDGPPALVVEVISPASRRKDRLIKMGIYQRANVQHYWIVDPEEKTLECFSLRDGLYALVASGMEEEVVVHPQFSGLAIHLKTLWGSKSL